MIQSYYAAVSYIDDLVGQMLSELKAVGLSNNTIILLVGDHGKFECTKCICHEPFWYIEVMYRVMYVNAMKNE